MSSSSIMRRRGLTPFSLAFLDIMSCGLGAVILVFLIIKHADESNPVNTNRFENDIAFQIEHQKTLEKQIEVLDRELAERTERLLQIRNQLASALIETSKIDGQSASLREQADIARADIEKVQQQTEDAVVEIENEGNRNYLIGMKVEGKRIVMLLDSSASMMAPDIIDIIRLKNSSDSQKLNAPKWTWSKRILQWLTAQLPKESRVRIMTFSSETVDHNSQKTWTDATQSKEVTLSLQSALDVVPNNGTNLEQAFEAVSRLNPNPDSLYIITDGLPTLHGDLGTFDLDRITSCFRSTSSTVTPKCRGEFFLRAMRKLYNLLPDIKTNVVLLPIEGDPGAAVGYWLLANQNNGILIAPTESWP